MNDQERIDRLAHLLMKVVILDKMLVDAKQELKAASADAMQVTAQDDPWQPMVSTEGH